LHNRSLSTKHKRRTTREALSIRWPSERSVAGVTYLLFVRPIGQTCSLRSWDARDIKLSRRRQLHDTSDS